MQAVLSSLKDIPGVLGSFVLTPQGALAMRDMPAVYPDQIFPDMGRRLATIGEVVDTQVGPIKELILKFEGCWLFVRHTAECLLSVLVSEEVNFPALKMATNVALKQVIEKMPSTLPAPAVPAAAVVAEAAPAPVAVSEPTPAPAPAPAAPVKARRMWRGQIIED